VLNKAKVRVSEQMIEILSVTGNEVVERDHLVSSFDETIAKV